MAKNGHDTPNETPDLHDLTGSALKQGTKNTKKIREGKIQVSKEVEAEELWRRIISMLFETGHPWIQALQPKISTTTRWSYSFFQSLY